MALRNLPWVRPSVLCGWVAILAMTLVLSACGGGGDSQGAAGQNGSDGAAGPQGLSGQNSNDGAAGPQGPSGHNGNDGAAGPAGPTGPTGPAGHPERMRARWW